MILTLVCTYFPLDNVISQGRERQIYDVIAERQLYFSVLVVYWLQLWMYAHLQTFL